MVWYATATIPTENRLDYVCLNICHLIDFVPDPVPSRDLLIIVAIAAILYTFVKSLY